MSGSKIVGYAALFDRPSEDRGGFRAVVRRGAFDRTLAARRDVIATLEHRDRYPVARTRHGTLFLAADRCGLYFEILDPPPAVAADVERGVYSGVSFWYRNARQEFGPGGRILELFDFDLYDVSLVYKPAFLGTWCKLCAG